MPARTTNSTGEAGLHSIPRYFGIGRALWIARLFHVLMLVLLMGLVAAFGLGKLAVAGVIVVALLLAYEHSLVSPNDLSKLNAAFFTMNGVISVVFFRFHRGRLAAEEVVSCHGGDCRFYAASGTSALLS